MATFKAAAVSKTPANYNWARVDPPRRYGLRNNAKLCNVVGQVALDNYLVLGPVSETLFFADCRQWQDRGWSRITK
jgi:hypothetical protein